MAVVPLDEPSGPLLSRVSAARAQCNVVVAWCALLATAALTMAALHVFTFSQAYPTSAIARASGLSIRATGQHFVEALGWWSYAGVPVVVAACTLLSLRAKHRSVSSRVDVDGAYRLSAFAIPALGLWTMSELLLTFDRVRDARSDIANGPALVLAVARIDHPWPLYGALLAATVLGWGVWRVRVHAARLVLGTVALWAIGQAALSWMELSAAHQFVKAEGSAIATSELFRTSSVCGWTQRVLCLLFVSFGAINVARLTRTKTYSRTALFCVVSGHLLALLMLIDVSRLVGVSYVSAAQRLQRVLSSTQTQPLSAIAPGGRIREPVSILHADGRLSSIQDGRIADLPAGASLPPADGVLTLLVDARCSVGDLVDLVAPVPEDRALNLGRVFRVVATGSAADYLPAARAADITVETVPLIGSHAQLLLWPNAQPQDLDALDAKEPVSKLVTGQPLRVARRASAKRQAPRPTSAASVGGGGWWLFGPVF